MCGCRLSHGSSMQCADYAQGAAPFMPSHLQLRRLCRLLHPQLRRQLSLLLAQHAQRGDRQVSLVAGAAGLSICPGGSLSLLIKRTVQMPDVQLELQGKDRVESSRAVCIADAYRQDQGTASGTAPFRPAWLVLRGTPKKPPNSPYMHTATASCPATLYPAYRLQPGCNVGGLPLRRRRLGALRCQLALQPRNLVFGCLDVWRQLSTPLILGFGQLGGEVCQALLQGLCLLPCSLLIISGQGSLQMAGSRRQAAGAVGLCAKRVAGSLGQRSAWYASILQHMKPNQPPISQPAASQSATQHPTQAAYLAPRPLPVLSKLV